jgi:hypothetical protein
VIAATTGLPMPATARKLACSLRLMAAISA